jgi:NADPH:quinone reductase
MSPSRAREPGYIRTKGESQVMKAIQYDRFGGPEVLEYVDLPEPVPGHGEVLIETSAIGVNFPDIRERLGIYNQAATRVGGVQLPQVGGLAVTGTVTAVGPGADPGLVGRPVVAAMKKGAYAQYALARQELTVAVDEGTDRTVLAGIAGQGMTAYLALQASTTLRGGESLLVHGAAGGVGGLAVQIGKALGAGPVIGTASTPERRQHVLDLGADAAIGYERPGWTDEVLALTDGHGVDVLFETIGGDVFDQNFDALATFGRYVLVGSTRGPGQALAPRRLMTRAQALIGFYLPVFYDRPDLISSALDFLARGLSDGQLTPAVDRVLPLSEAATAHKLLEERAVQGVVVLDPAG